MNDLRGDLKLDLESELDSDLQSILAELLDKWIGDYRLQSTGYRSLFTCYQLPDT